MAWEAGLVKGLRELGRREGATLYMVLSAGFKVVLSRLSGQTDMVIGTAIANRNREETEGLVGFFVNTLAVRSDLGGNPEFGEVVRREREALLGAYAHQDVPFEKLVEALQPERDMSRSPLFQVMLVLQNAPMKGLAIGGWETAGLEVETGTAKFDLTVTLVEAGEELVGTAEYSSDLYEAESIERLMRHWERVMRWAVEQGGPIEEVDLLSEGERRQVVEEWNRTGEQVAGKNVVEQFEAQVKARSETVAVVAGAETVSYGELNARANALAHRLREEGVGPESLVGICVERGVGMVVGILGILKAGGAYVPLDPAYPEQRLEYMLGDAQIGILVVGPGLRERVKGYGGRILELETCLTGPTSDLGITIEPQQLIYVMYTSGSTGQPKATAVTHEGVVRSVRESNYVELSAADTFLQFAPISFDASTFESVGALLNRARLVMALPTYRAGGTGGADP